MKVRSVGFGLILRVAMGLLCCNASAGVQDLTRGQKVELATAVGRFLVVFAQHAQANNYQNAAPALTITSDLLRVANDVCAGINHEISFPSGSVATMDVISLLSDVWDTAAAAAADDEVTKVTIEKKEIIFVSDDTQKRTIDSKDKKANKIKVIEIPQPVVKETIITKSPEVKNETRALTEHETQLLATYLAPLIEAAAAVGIVFADEHDEQSKKIITTLQWLVLFARFYPEFFQKNLRVATSKALFSLIIGYLLAELKKPEAAPAVSAAAPDTRGAPVVVAPKNKKKHQPRDAHLVRQLRNRQIFAW